jgi:adenylate kinase family enzyme
MNDAKRELELTRELAELGAEIAELKFAAPQKSGSRKKKRTIEVVETELKSKRDELLDIKVVENTGWVLVDFPTNFSQSMLLEKALSGYSIPADLDPTTRE